MRSFLLLMLAPAAGALFLGSKQVLTLTNGRTARVTGSGPPLVFSGGLYGFMPSVAYSHVLGDLRKTHTIVTTDGGRLARAEFEQIADTLAAERLGLVAHSAFDPTILGSDRLEAAVLCDPACTPIVASSPPFLAAPRFDVEARRVRVLFAQRAIEGEHPFVPELFVPVLEGASVERLEYADAGHADLMDDFFADAASRMGIHGIADGRAPPLRAFGEWSAAAAPEVAKSKERKAYRAWVVARIQEFFAKGGPLVVSTPLP
jgi:hypothetical protein